MWHFASPTVCAPLPDWQHYLSRLESVEPRDETVLFAIQRAARAIVQSKENTARPQATLVGTATA